MTLPLFGPGQDPGPSFSELLRRSGFTPRVETGPDVQIPHGTTIVAIRYSEGVVMAGDRRATEGYSIAHRAIEKVYPADRHSGVSIAGAAGFAVEMVKLFQTELEHYEKVEGMALSLEGKANKLGQMVRSNLGMAMEGLAVVPIYAGYDLRRRVGRIFKYDITGGRYEEDQFHATGSGGRDARTTIKLGYRDNMERAEALELSIEALYEAADEDAATGGPDVVRGIYPTVATITADGFERAGEDEVAERFRTLIQRKSAEDIHGERERTIQHSDPVIGAAAKGGDTVTMPFGYVSPEQAMKDRADFARKNVAKGRPLVALVYADGVLLCAENPSRTLHKVSEIYDRIAFAGVGKYAEFDGLRTAGIRIADLKGYQYSREDVDARSLANAYGQHLNQIFTHEMKPLEVEILVAEVGYELGGDQLFHILYDGTVFDEQQFSVLGGDADTITERLRGTYQDGMARAVGIKAAVNALAGPERQFKPTELEVAFLDRAGGRRVFRRPTVAELEELLAG